MLEQIFAGPLPELDLGPIESLPELDDFVLPFDFDIDDIGTYPVAPADDKPRAAPTAGSAKSVRISIGLPGAVIHEYKRRAAIAGKGYQTLIKKTLLEDVSRTR